MTDDMLAHSVSSSKRYAIRQELGMREMMTCEQTDAIRERVANWPRGYWLATDKKASLMQNGEEGPREIAFISADYSAVIDLLTHAYADMQAMLSEVDRLLADALAECKRISEKQDAYLNYLSVENARLRAQIAGTLDEAAHDG